MMRLSKLWTRALAWLATLSLLAALLPASAPRARAAEDGVVRFLFGQSVYTGDAQPKEGDPRKIVEYSGERNWIYLDDTAPETAGYFVRNSDHICMIATQGAGQWAAFEIILPNAGTYKVSMNAFCRTRCGLTGLYFFPSDGRAIADAIGEETMIGQVDHTGNNVWRTDEFGEVTVPQAGKYVLVLRGDGQVSGKENIIYCKEITFERIAVLDAVSLDIGNDSTLTAGEYAEPVVKGLSSDGTALNLAEGEILLESGNPQIARIGKDGKIYALSPGEADITATVTLNEVTRRETVTLRILEALPFAGVDADYKFQLGAYGETSDDVAKDYTEYTDSRLWAYLDSKVSGTVSKPPLISLLSSPLVMQCPCLGGDWIAFRIKVETAGSYQAALSAYCRNAAAIIDCYLIPYGAEAAGNIPGYLTEDYWIGAADTYSSGTGIFDFALNTVRIPQAGEYILVLSASRKNNMASAFNMYPSAFSLRGKDSMKNVLFSVEDTQIAPGDRISYSIAAQNDSGAIDLEQAYVECYTEDPDVLAVNEESGEVTALSAGEAELRALVVYQGIAIEKSVHVTVDNAFEATGVTMLGSKRAYRGGQFRLTPAIELANGEQILPTQAEISYTVRSQSPENAVLVEEGARLQANQAGSAVVQARCVFRGKTLVSDEITLTVAEGLSALSGQIVEYRWEPGEKGSDPSQYTEYGEGREWAYLTAAEAAPVSLGDLGLELGGGQGDWAAVKLRIPAAGRYQIYLNAWCGSDMGNASLYLIPCDSQTEEHVADYMLGIYEIGSADLYRAEDGLEEIRLEDVEVAQAGEYILAMRAAGKNAASDGYRLSLKSLILDGVSVVNEVSVELSPSPLGSGESAEITVAARLSDGRSVPLEDAEVDLTVSAEELIELDAENFTARALREGDGQVIAQVRYKGVSAQGAAVLQCRDAYGIENVLLFGGAQAEIGSQYTIEPAVELRNKELLAIDKEKMTYRVVEESEEGVLEIDGEGAILARKIGSAKIKGEVTLRGKTFESETISVSVVPAKQGQNSNFEISFNRADYPSDSLGSIEDAKLYSQSRMWAYLESKLVAPAYNSFDLSVKAQFTSGLLQVLSGKDDYIALKAKLYSPGDYKVTMSALCRNRSGIIGLYVFPLNAQTQADVEGQLTAETKLGELDTYALSNENRSGEIGKLSVENAGEYIIVLRLDGKNSSSSEYIMYPQKILFENMSGLDSAILSVEKNTINVGESIQSALSLYQGDGELLPPASEGQQVVYVSDNPEIASVDSAGLISGVSEGSTKIRAHVTRGGVSRSGEVDIRVQDPSEVQRIYLDAPESIWVYGQAQIRAMAQMASGNVVAIPASEVSFALESVQPEGAATLSEEGLLTGLAVGTARIKAATTFHGIAQELTPVTVEISWDASIDPAIYTLDERAAIKENAQKYAWAREEVESVQAAADRYVELADRLWSMVVPEGLFRYYHVGEKYDPDKFKCRYCGVDISLKYGNAYGWRTDPLDTEWKIQCPDCRRWFPSNDFGGYYQLGLDEHGVFQQELAKERNAQLVAEGKDGYLKNLLYPEMDKKLGVTGWGVDDGFGYFTGKTYDNGVPEKHTYIAFYIHEGIWGGTNNHKVNAGVIREGLTSLSKAFLYTGEAKYGRAGAIVLDRIADFYPDFDWYQWAAIRPDNYRGHIVDAVQECPLAQDLAEAYDMLLPIYNDPNVVNFLSAQAEKYGLSDKSSPGALRKNVEDNILREIYQGALYGDIGGNFGMTQSAVAAAAVALNQMPESGDWIDWLMKPGEVKNTGPKGAPRTGGNILTKLMDVVSRDGTGNEAAPGYNRLWISYPLEAAEYLHGYEKAKVDLYENPKFRKSFASQIPLILGGHYTVQIGDSGAVGSTGITYGNIQDAVKIGFLRTGDPGLAQVLYKINGEKVKGLHSSITERDPERIQQQVQAIIDEKGALTIESEMMTGYGFAALKDGNRYKAPIEANALNTTRDFWLYFGYGTGHGHLDGLSFGLDAFGMNMAPDLGYPEQTGTQPHRIQWVQNTLSHNTVMVNQKTQTGLSPHGTPLHFDDSGRVKVMDADASAAYPETDVYRRTIVMVEAEGDVSYGVDFFRIVGGDDHLYSFHSHSDEIFETENLNLVAQTDAAGNYVGTYAGKDVPYGPDPDTILTSSATNYLRYPAGYTWLDCVRRDSAPSESFAVDFKIKDFRSLLPKEQDLHLRMTALNDFAMNEVAIAHGTPPQTGGNPEYLEYVLARRSGKDLRTLFTTVYEPYEEQRYLQSIENVGVVRLEGRQSLRDTVKAVKVTHVNGRVDYIVYATNNQVLYRVDDRFDFRGFVGVYSLSGEQPVLTYLNDGDILGESAGNTAAIYRKGVGFHAGVHVGKLHCHHAGRSFGYRGNRGAIHLCGKRREGKRGL